LRNYFIAIFGFIPIISSSQILHLPEHKAPLQTTTYSKHQADAVSFTSNQAALANFTKTAFGVYGEKRFMLQELSLFAGAFVVPTSSGNFGLSVRRFGSSDYNQTETGLAYGRKLGEKAAIGAQFNYHSFKVKGYGDASYLSIDAGTIFQLSSHLRAGFHVYQPAENLQEKDSEVMLPAVYEVGVGYDASEQLFLTAIVCKTEGADVQVNAAIQYAIKNSLVCKAGIMSGSSSFYIGGGVVLKTFRIDAITSFHPHLGITPGVLILFHLPDK
jgi:hypothetical protein